MSIEYKESDFIQTAKDGEGFGHRRDYKYRVLNRTGHYTHHTNDLKDARWWFKKCVALWEKNQPDPHTGRYCADCDTVIEADEWCCSKCGGCL